MNTGVPENNNNQVTEEEDETEWEEGENEGMNGMENEVKQEEDEQLNIEGELPDRDENIAELIERAQRVERMYREIEAQTDEELDESENLGNGPKGVDKEFEEEIAADIVELIKNAVLEKEREEMDRVDMENEAELNPNMQSMGQDVDELGDGTDDNMADEQGMMDAEQGNVDGEEGEQMTEPLMNEVENDVKDELELGELEGNNGESEAMTEALMNEGQSEQNDEDQIRREIAEQKIADLVGRVLEEEQRKNEMVDDE